METAPTPEESWGTNPDKEPKPEEVKLHWMPPTEDARGFWSAIPSWRHHYKRSCNEHCFVVWRRDQ